MAETDRGRASVASVRGWVTDSRASPLEVWAVGTFDVVFLTLLVVLGGHVTGVVTETLPDLGTLPGLAVFAYLWVLAVLAVRWALAAGGLDRVAAGERTPLLARGAAAGGVGGLAFVVGPVLVIGTGGVLVGTVSLRSVVAVGGIATSLAGIVGTLVGFLLALVDVSLFLAVEAVLPGTAT